MFHVNILQIAASKPDFVKASIASTASAPDIATITADPSPPTTPLDAFMDAFPVPNDNVLLGGSGLLRVCDWCSTRTDMTGTL